MMILLNFNSQYRLIRGQFFAKKWKIFRNLKEKNNKKIWKIIIYNWHEKWCSKGKNKKNRKNKIKIINRMWWGYENGVVKKRY